MNKLICLLGAGLLLGAAVVGWSDDSGEIRREALIGVGAGAAEVWYGAGAAGLFSSLEATGVGHLDLETEVLAGWAVVPGLYLLAIAEIYGTSFKDYTGAYVIMYNAVAGAGFRWYPTPLGLFAQVSGGAAWAMIDSSLGVSEASPMGYGGSATIGWDFRLGGGFSLVAGLSAFYVSVLNWQAWGGGLSGSLAWKSGTSSRQ